jgi:hypothetical protein
MLVALYYKPECWGFESWWGEFLFNPPNPSSRTMTLGSTQPLTEMNRNEYQESSWGLKSGWRARLTTLPSSMGRLSRENLGPSTSTILWAFTTCYRDSFTFTLRYPLPSTTSCGNVTSLSPSSGRAKILSSFRPQTWSTFWGSWVCMYV